MKVSICIPTYNQSLYLEQAIMSAVHQSLAPVEIIVSNDCSTDNTKEVLKKLQNDIPILKIINQPKNLGITRNTNACLRLATGDFIVRLDSDDYLAPDFTKNLTEKLLYFPEAGYAHAAVQEINQKGELLQTRNLFRKAGFQTGQDALKASIKGYRVAANIIMFRRTALEKVGFISSQIDFAEDYHLSASLAAEGFGNIYLDEVLSFYRVWIDAGNVRQKRKLAEVIGLRKVFEDVIEPAYNQKGWNLDQVKSSRTSLACGHANCLSWRVYNTKEKEELIMELQKLSSARKARLYVWLYLNGFGSFLNLYNRINSVPKNLIKTFFLK